MQYILRIIGMYYIIWIAKIRKDWSALHQIDRIFKVMLSLEKTNQELIRSFEFDH